MEAYDFDRITDRRNTFSYKWDIKEGELPMWVADMDFETAPCVKEALIRRAEHGIFGYSVVPQEWNRAICGWWQRRHHFQMQEDWLIFCTGVIPAIDVAVKRMTNVGDNVVVQTPVYNIFYNCVENHGRHVLENRLLYEKGQYEMDFEDLEKKLANPQTTMLLLCNPQNPAGKIWSKEELARVGALCKKHHVLVVADEIHCDLTMPGYAYVPFASVSDDCKYNSITCLAPSKTFNLAGMMISNVIIRDEGLKEIWLGRHYNFDNPLSIAAAQAAYEKGEPWLEELRAYLDENFRFTGEYLKEHLPKAKYRVSEATYLAWVDLNAYFEPDEHLPLFFAYKAGVLLEGGNMFVQNSDGFIRLNLACPKATLAEGLRRICEAVNTKHTEKYLGEK